ncbi:hypothetical protein JCM11251_002034 [Rhodosporidiobolus azoricus]
MDSLSSIPTSRPPEPHPSLAMHSSPLHVFPSAVSPSALPAYLRPRRPLAPTSPNVLSPRTGAPSSAVKPAPSSSRPKKTASSSAKSRTVVKHEDTDGNASASGYDSPSHPQPQQTGVDPQTGAPLFLAPDYTLNPAGPASSASTDFKCPQCDKVYRGKHARSIWRRHLQDKHGIPLSQQPRRTRWDNDANRPKSEEEKRARTLDSKRRWARKNRASASTTKNGSASASTHEPSVAGSVGTPASDDEYDDAFGAGPSVQYAPQQQQQYAGEGDESADADSSFDATSVAGWSTEGAAAMNGLAGRSGSAGPAGQANPFYPAAPSSFAQGPAVVRKPLAEGGRAYGGRKGSAPPQRAAYGADVQDGHHLSHYSYSGHHSPSHTPGNASPFHPSAGHSANPYSHPYALPTLPPLGIEQPHYDPHYPPSARYDPRYDHQPHPHDSLHPVNPLLAPHPHALRRPASNPNALLHPSSAYDAPPPAPPSGSILAGQIAPVARAYSGRLGAAAGARGPSPSRSALESPVKLGGGGRAKAPPSLTGVASAIANGSSGAATANGKEHPREDAAGILLALKAGPSSPMGLSPAHSHLHAAVQSPVSNLRDRDTGDEQEEGTEGDDEDDEDGAEAEVRALMGVGKYQQQPHGPAGSGPPLRGGLIGAGGVPLVSPQKRRRSASPASFHHHAHHPPPPPPQHSSAPMMASSSSSGGEGGSSTSAAAHALLATAKKAHSSSARPAWSHASLVATPTPGGLMQSMMESSPAVRFGAATGGGGAAEESDGDQLVQGEEGDEAGDLRGVADEPFTSSSGGRHRRRRSESPSSGRRRGGAASSSGASSSSQPQRGGLHHHHPVGLTSELGDLDFRQQPSSSSSGRVHHHHDPLRDVDAAPMLPPASTAHLKTPAPASRNGISASAIPHDPSLLSSAARPSPLPHHHDPFLAHPAPSASGASGIPPASAAAIRTSSPPFGAYTTGGFLFSSPAHPQFSKTLGLASMPGPGVMSYALGSSAVGGDTPAAATGKIARQRQISNGSVVSLDGVLARTPGVLETPVRGGALALVADDEFDHSRRGSLEEEEGDLGQYQEEDDDEEDTEEVESPERVSGSRRESTQEEEED